MLLAGLATGAIAAVAGMVSYYTVPGNHTEEAHQRVYWHIWTMVAAVVLFTVVCFVRWQHPSVVSPTIRGLGLVAAASLLFGGYIGGKLVYHGGLGVDPAILKPDLRSRPVAINSSPATPTGQSSQCRPDEMQKVHRQLPGSPRSPTLGSQPQGEAGASMNSIGLPLMAIPTHYPACPSIS